MAKLEVGKRYGYICPAYCDGGNSVPAETIYFNVTRPTNIGWEVIYENGTHANLDKDCSKVKGAFLSTKMKNDTPALSKPNIEDVFGAFKNFQTAQLQASRWLDLAGLGVAMQKAQNEFRDQMEKFGLAEHIDWTDKSD